MKQLNQLQRKKCIFELLDENGNAVKRNVEWTVKDTSSGHLSKSTTDTGADQTTIFSLISQVLIQ